MLVPGVVGAAPLAQESQEGQSYTVQKDDTLWSIAEKYLGKGSAYTAIAAATNDKHEKDATFARIDNPNLIKLGWKLFIPSAEEATKPVAPEPCAPGSQPCVATWPAKPAEPGATPTVSTVSATVAVTPTSTPSPAPPTVPPEASPTPTRVLPVTTQEVDKEMTISLDYFYAMTLLLVLLFALIGFELGQVRSLVALLSVFLGYAAAQLCATFIRDGLNFVLKLELGDEVIPYFQGFLFLGSVIAVLCYLFGIGYKHTFKDRLFGMLLGDLSGYIESVFTLEFLRELLAGALEEQTVMFDFSYALLGQEGLFVLTINFFSDPERAYTVLRKGLVPAILCILFYLLWRALNWLFNLLLRIWNRVLNWLSIRGGEVVLVPVIPIIIEVKGKERENE